MAKKPTAYGADEIYKGRVRRPVTLGAFKFLPRHETEFTGATLNAIAEQEGEDVFEASEA